jgi:CheY-like chemotaxis protein
VLVVDDEDDIRLIAAEALRRLGGWEVSTAASGAEALVVARERTPDAIVLDVMMPELDGPATLAALRAETATASIPVVFLTAKVQVAELQQLEQLNVAGVLPKPFDPVTLADDLGRAFGWS